MAPVARARAQRSGQGWRHLAPAALLGHYHRQHLWMLLARHQQWWQQQQQQWQQLPCQLEEHQRLRAKQTRQRRASQQLTRQRLLQGQVGLQAPSAPSERVVSSHNHWETAALHLKALPCKVLGQGKAFRC